MELNFQDVETSHWENSLYLNGNIYFKCNDYDITWKLIFVIRDDGIYCFSQ